MLRFSFTRLPARDQDGHQFKFQAEGDDSIKPAIRWSIDQFGHPEDARRYGSRWDHGRITFWFRDEADAMHFRLRWC